MKRIIAALLVALFVLVGGGFLLACPYDGDGQGPAVYVPDSGGSSTTSTQQAPTDQTAQPPG